MINSSRNNCDECDSYNSYIYGSLADFNRGLYTEAIPYKAAIFFPNTEAKYFVHQIDDDSTRI